MGSKLLRETKKGEKRSRDFEADQGETAIFGVYRSPNEFVDEALATKHPMDSTDAVEPPSKAAVTFVASNSAEDVCRFRLHQLKLLREWSAELASEEDELHANLEQHIARLLVKKKLLLFRKLLRITNYPETDSVSHTA